MSQHPITDPQDFSDLLKQNRKRLGLNQTQLANMHDLSRYTVVDAESGRGDPKLSTVLTLLRGLGLSLVAVPTHMVGRINLPDEAEVQDLTDDEPNFDEVDFDG
jgi:DNA-binding XRE family transcriptional regulator